MTTFVIVDECDAKEQGKIKGTEINQKYVFADGDGGIYGHCPLCIHNCKVKVAKK